MKNDQDIGWQIINKQAQKRIRLRDGESRTDNGMPLVLSQAAPEQFLAFEVDRSAIQIRERAELPKENSELQTSAVASRVLSPAVRTILANVADGVYKIKINGTGKYLAVAGQFDKRDGASLILVLGYFPKSAMILEL